MFLKSLAAKGAGKFDIMNSGGPQSPSSTGYSMCLETYEICQPINDLPAKLLVSGLYDDLEGFRVLLSKEDERIAPFLRIQFEGVEAYRNIDEGNRLRLWEGGNDFRSGSLYIVHNSNWLEWFHAESRGVRESEELKHYSIVTPMDVIDVITGVDPVVEWVGL